MRIAFFLLVLITCESSFAQTLPNRLKYYQCPTKSAALQCNADCKFEGIETEYKVNPANNTVMAIDFVLKDKTQESRILDRCKVVDTENWQCDRIPDKLVEKQITTMTKGKVFINTIYAIGNSQAYSCDK